MTVKPNRKYPYINCYDLYVNGTKTFVWLCVSDGKTLEIQATQITSKKPVIEVDLSDPKENADMRSHKAILPVEEA